jgi:transposase
MELHYKTANKSPKLGKLFKLAPYLVYKVEEAGRHLIAVDPAYTSQKCSQCGFRKKKELHESLFKENAVARDIIVIK